MRKSIILISILLISFSMKPDKPAYTLFNAKGKEVKYKSLVKAVLNADMVFFGELHNNPINHWLQFELTKDIHKSKNAKLVLGAEMIEANYQALLNKYLDDEFDSTVFADTVKLWPNYKTDYKPLVEFAKANKLTFVASNIPRSFASLVNKKGFEALEELSAKEKSYIAPLPIKYDPELKGYKDMIEMLKDMPHVTANIAKAQAIKDATMAHFILQNWKKGEIFLHFNGSYHSKDYQGISWYLLQENPNLKIVTIASGEQENIKKLEKENLNLANFILITPKTMTKTY
ncbi:MAG: ChaN family lipoprotein [Bacteroidetes bacterium]|nr:ChaN family lipoprotein [Bacteroidota bacterium]